MKNPTGYNWGLCDGGWGGGQGVGGGAGQGLVGGGGGQGGVWGDLYGCCCSSIQQSTPACRNHHDNQEPFLKGEFTNCVTMSLWYISL